jgi:hypothetical protein
LDNKQKKASLRALLCLALLLQKRNVNPKVSKCCPLLGALFAPVFPKYSQIIVYISSILRPESEIQIRFLETNFAKSPKIHRIKKLDHCSAMFGGLIPCLFLDVS